MKRFLLPALCALFLLILIPCQSYAIPLPDSFENAIHQIQDLSSTVKSFSLTIYSVVSFFTKLLGFAAVLLFFAALVTSSGLVSVGVPPGKVSFFLALGFWDVLWVLWVSASGNLDTAFGLNFAEVNAKVSLPFIIFEIIRSGIPWIWSTVLRLFGKGYSRRRLAHAAGELALTSARLQASISQDMARSSRNVVLSRESINAARDLSAACKKILSGAGELKENDSSAIDPPDVDSNLPTH